MRKIFILLFILCLMSCRKDIMNSRTPDPSMENRLTLGMVKKVLQAKLQKDHGGQLAKRASGAGVDLTEITQIMADSVYAKFYWDYAAEEQLIDGYPAILVPIIMKGQVKGGVVDGMASRGYRVAVFQHNYEKNDILLSYRDYFPYEQKVLAAMEDREIPIYPTNFLAFYDVIGENFSGHILHLDQQLRPLRLMEVQDNKMIKYLDLPFASSAEENPLIKYPYQDIFASETDRECSVQIAYPQTEITYTQVRYHGDGPVGQVGSINNGFSLYGFDIGMRMEAEYRTIWKTETISVGGCNLAGAGAAATVNVGIGTQLGWFANLLLGIDDCYTKAKLRMAMQDKAKVDAVNSAKGKNGEQVEAGYTMKIHDLAKPDETVSSAVFNNNSRDHVNIPFSWNQQEGYVTHSTHGHPGGMPHSIDDIFVIGVNAYEVASHAHSTDLNKKFFMSNYTDVVEAGGGEFYVVTVTNIDQLILKTYGNSLPEFLANKSNLKKQFNDFLDRNIESPELRLNFLLNYFGSALRFYYGERDEFGNIVRFDRLGYNSNNSYDSAGIDCPD